MSNTQIQRALAVHRELPPTIQARTLPRARELAAFLSEIIVHACAKLQDQKQLLSTEARSQEDTYIAYIVTLIEQRVHDYGWHVCEQDLGGLPTRESPERGRRDLTIKKGGDAPFAIIEALRCGGCTKTEASNIKEHIARLTARYDQCGGAHPIVLVYANAQNFSEFWSWYPQQFSSEAFKDLNLVNAPIVPGEWETGGLVRRLLKLLQTEHMVAHEVVAVTHVIVSV
jgi:hypothetical protein